MFRKLHIAAANSLQQLCQEQIATGLGSTRSLLWLHWSQLIQDQDEGSLVPVGRYFVQTKNLQVHPPSKLHFSVMIAQQSPFPDLDNTEIDFHVSWSLQPHASDDFRRLCCGLLDHQAQVLHLPGSLLGVTTTSFESKQPRSSPFAIDPQLGHYDGYLYVYKMPCAISTILRDSHATSYVTRPQAFDRTAVHDTFVRFLLARGESLV